MRFFDWLIRRAPGPTEPAPEIAPTAEAVAHGISVIVSEDEVASEPTAEQVADRRRFILEPYFAMIEYTDAKGNLSRRRITMRSVDEVHGVRHLNAICHERRALRTFRLDRVSCLISQYGEVEDAAPWFAEILATAEVEIVPAKTTPPSSPRDIASTATGTVSAYTALRREISPALTLLLAVARSDDFLHHRELDRILRYAEDEAMYLRDSGKLPSMPYAEEFDKLERTVRRLRPSRDDLVAALSGIEDWGKDRKTKLAAALADTAGADGNVDAIEAELIDEFRASGARHHGHGWDG